MWIVKEIVKIGYLAVHAWGKTSSITSDWVKKIGTASCPTSFSAKHSPWTASFSFFSFSLPYFLVQLASTWFTLLIVGGELYKVVLFLLS